MDAGSQVEQARPVKQRGGRRGRVRGPATQACELSPIKEQCPACGQFMRVAYLEHRTVVRLDGVWRLTVRVRRCRNAGCTQYHRPFLPEEAGAWALPQAEFGLDVLALVGHLRYREQRSVPQIHQPLRARGVEIAERSVTELLHRYEELVALRLGDAERLRAQLAEQGGVILAIDGLQPDVGHEVLWVLRDVRSGAVLLARSLLSATEDDLAPLLAEVRDVLVGPDPEQPVVPILGVVSDGQHSLRKAVARALPGVPHQLCQFHYLREAARPIFEADRHAKKELKKRVRGVRPIERALEGRRDTQAEAVRGYCLAIRSALTDDGRPPLAAHIAWLEQAVDELDGELDQMLHASPLWRERDHLLRRVPGAGPTPTVSLALLAHLPSPERGHGSGEGRWPPWSGWPSSTATVARGPRRVPSRAADGRYGPSCTWRRW